MSNMVIQTNVLALNSHRALKGVGTTQATASSRLSSGFRINSAADDAAGLAISEKMRSQIRGLDMASKNAQDAISLIQTAEGGMQEIDNMIQRIRELTVQVSNDTNENNKLGTGDRQKIQDEIDQLVGEIDSMADRVEFNKKKVIDGSFADTAATLSSMTKEFDAATTTAAAAAARVAALTTALGTKGTVSAVAYNTTTKVYDVTSTGGSGVADALDQATQAISFATTGAQAEYNAAVTTYASAEATYEIAQATYNTAKQTLIDALGKDPASVTTAELNAWAKDGDAGESADKVNAVNAYLTAAKAWGKDDFGLGDKVIAGLGSSIDNDATVKYLTTFAAADFDGTAGAVNVFDLAKTAMKTAQSKYDTAVATKTSAQAAYDSVQQKLADAQAEQATALKALKAATTKKDAAGAANDQGTAKKLFFQVGANANQKLMMSIGSVKSDMLGIGDGNGNTSINVVFNSGVDITSTLDILDTALSYVTTERSKLGAAQNRLEYTMKSLDISSENLSAAESRIRDTDMAKEMMNLTKANVLQQAATSMLAQANQAPQSILQLLK